jgi:hypothetical protein
MESFSHLINIVSSAIPQQFGREDVRKVISISAAMAVLYSAYKLASNSSKKKTNQEQGLKKIPVPSGSYPIFGHLLSLGVNPGRTIANWHKELGSIIKIHMGVKEWILVDDPALAHKIFVTYGAVCSNRIHQTYSSHYYSIDGL